MKGRTSRPAYTAAAIIIVVAVVIFFVVFTDNGQYRKPSTITLPDIGSEEEISGDTEFPSEDSPEAHKVEVNRDNILSIVRAIKRPDKYYMELETSVYYSGRSLTTEIRHWVNGGQSVTRSVKAGNTTPVYVMRTEDTVKIWYENSEEFYQTSAANYSDDDAAGIMTYEDVLTTKDRIVSAQYAEQNGCQCIYIETEDDELSYRKEYYVDVDRGLLVSAKTYKESELIYSMDVSVIDEDISAMDKLFEN